MEGADATVYTVLYTQHIWIEIFEHFMGDEDLIWLRSSAPYEVVKNLGSDFWAKHLLYN